MTTPIDPTDPEGERKWSRFKIKAFLVIAAVVVAANYERCTETPQERARKDALSSQRIESISAETAYDDCKNDGAEQDCHAAAQRAAEIAREKSRLIYGR